jgi:Ala-tRNA(Pro) deacylase
MAELIIDCNRNRGGRDAVPEAGPRTLSRRVAIAYCGGRHLASENAVTKTRADLIAFLDSLGIDTTTHQHPPLFTVEDSNALRGDIPGGHTKNLFVKDKKDNVFLLTVDEHAEVDLKTIHTRIGGSGRVSFGKPELLMDLLGVLPGSVTIFGLINDTQGRVTAFLDEGLMKNDVINGHPLTNEATTSIRRDDLARFVEATGHAVNILKLTA